MIELKPTKCNLCGGDVIYASNAVVYGREYGSGYCYYCTSCGAFVGTNKPYPDIALGILADEKMRQAKIRCHDVFDIHWRNKAGNEKHIEQHCKDLRRICAYYCAEIFIAFCGKLVFFGYEAERG